MRVPDNHILSLTLALRHPETALPAIEALRDATGKAEVEGLVEVLYGASTARFGVAAIEALEKAEQPIVVDALLHALGSEHTTVRLEAVRALQRRGEKRCLEKLKELYLHESSWLVRRAVLWAVADLSGEDWHWILQAANDPHWRVRHALIRAILRRDLSPQDRDKVKEMLSLAGDSRSLGVLRYLQYRWTGDEPEPPKPPENDLLSASFWDWDPAVLLHNLENIDETNLEEALQVSALLLEHDDERVRSCAADILRRFGETEHLARAVAATCDRRAENRADFQKLMDLLNDDRKEETARFILHMKDPFAPQLAWAIDQAENIFPADEESHVLEMLMEHDSKLIDVVSAALARLASRWQHTRASEWRNRFLHHEAATVQLKKLSADGAADSQELLAQLQNDPHPHVRAAALTPDRAAELVADPTQETSWHVLAEAARLMRVPLWHLEPEQPWQPEKRQETKPSNTISFHLPKATEERRTTSSAHATVRLYDELSAEKVRVSRMAISGAYGLPVEGFIHAVESGINLFFWEPTYQNLTDFWRRLSPRDRASLHLISGTFAADERRIRLDIERVLRQLRIERLDFFQLFWVRSRRRFADEVRRILDKLMDEGKIATYGLSTHDRALAVEAIEIGWNPIMVRHSAAHPGAEEKIFPKAIELGTSVITFNNTCYGRLLQARENHPAPTAADCYRYTLEKPDVTVCLSAPASMQQLEENISAWREPELSQEARENLLAQGKRVYKEDTMFRKLVRAL